MLRSAGFVDCYIGRQVPARWKHVSRSAFFGLGGLRAARWLNRGGLRILMYHRFGDAGALEWQCRHLRECYRPISLTEAAPLLQSGRPLPANSVAVTVDDGYRDAWSVAYPVFTAFQIPATVYLVTDFLDRRVWLWVDQVRYAVLHTRRQNLRLELPGNAGLEFSLASEDQRGHAATRICESLKLLRNENRLATLARIPELLDVTLPGDPPSGCEPLEWSNVREMARGGVEFGAHTRRHPILSRVQSAAELADEIAGSKQRIEEELGEPVRHFCYPNGTEPDISKEAVDAVRAAGFETATTTQPGLNYPGEDLFRLRRVPVDPTQDPAYFQQCVAAFRI